MPATLDDVANRLERIERGMTRLELEQRQNSALLSALIIGEKIMSKQLDDLATQVSQVETVEQSAITLIQGLAAQIAASANDPAAIQALAARLLASSTALAAAVTANTPSAPPSAPPSTGG